VEWWLGLNCFFCGNYDDSEKLVTKLAPRKEKYGDLNIFSRLWVGAFCVSFPISRVQK